MPLREMQARLGASEVALWIAEFVLRSQEEEEAIAEAQKGGG